MYKMLISNFCWRNNAGTIYDGDRRFSLQVRLPESIRSNIEALKRLPIKLPDIVKKVPGIIANTQAVPMSR